MSEIYKAKKRPPFGFILDELADLEPRVRQMFGCHAIYLGEKIMLLLRARENSPEYNGVWVVTSKEHHAALFKDFPALTENPILGSWLFLPANAREFDDTALALCAAIRNRDKRLGRIPKPRKSRRRARSVK